MSLEQLGAIRRRLVGRFSIDPEAEWTIEVNPEDASAEALAGWRELGFDRVSLGLQALDDRALRFLGRRHDAAAARASVTVALEPAPDLEPNGLAGRFDIILGRTLFDG